ncbi:MAG: DUF1015 domain-containing protein [Treponema sp.]|jgi:uncharacterized protein (DUF1015 family)|nr:DUF1015 domain-containing protein [Treponema sp.]
MTDIQTRFEKLGISIPEILLPQAELKQWAVIACDQFTQDRAYWKKASEIAAGSPSSLNLIFPEAFLDEENRVEKIENIHRAMRNYLDSGVFAAPRKGFVYLERDTPFNRCRKGLVAIVDLEQYSWSPTARPMIRSTEGTVADRLPPRMAIRQNAPVETPHILLLIDDETNSLLQGLEERAKKNEPVYHGELMLDSGNISGWFLNSEDDFAFLADRLEELAHRALTRYETSASQSKPVTQPASPSQPFLFAVGDGNHSLASAKEIWEEYKKANGGVNNHPCRYALVEIENIYDPAIKFEPIHRIVFGLGFDEALNVLSALPGFSSRTIGGQEELVRLTREPVKGNRFGLINQNRYALVETITGGLSTACLQPLLDNAVGASKGTLSIDYIHGEDELFRISHGTERPVTGILLPPVQKTGFFETVARNGPLPRKSFSMGEASEKRFYIECRKLFG